MKYKEVMQKPNITWISNDAISKRINAEFYDVEIGNVVNKMKQVFGDNIKNLTEFIILKDTGRNYLDTNQSNSYKYLKVNNLKEVLPDYSSLSYINKEDINTKDKLLEVGDILFVRVGVTSGVSSIIASKDVRGCFSDNIIRIRLNQDILNPFYCSVFLSSKYGKTLINRHLKGTARPLISYELFEDVIIPVPSIETQKYIGDKVLMAEELREISDKVKKEYEDLIREIYCDSNTNKFPKGIYYVHDYDFDEKSLRIDSNFYHPLYNYENIKCKHIIKLSELAKLKKNSKIMAKEEYIYYEIGDLSTSKVLEDKERIMGSKLPGRAKLELRMNDIIISLVQESIEVTSYVDMKLKNALTTNGCAVLEPKDKSLSAYLYAIMSSEFFIAQKCKYISGTNIRSMSKDDLLDMSIPIVEQKIIDKIVELVNIEFSNIRKAKQLIQEAKQDVEDLIEGKFDMSKLNETTTESR